MAMIISTNVASITAQKNLRRSTSALGQTFERLSSGMRINRAADDAAGLAVATRMGSQIRGFNQAIRNTNDAISMIQVAEGAVSETESALQRIRELSVQAANDTLVTSDREDIWQEVNQLLSEVDRIATDTEYNGQQLLGGTGSVALSRTFQVGADANKTVDLTVNVAGTSAIGVDVDDMLTATSMAALTNTAQQTKANSVITMVDSAIASVSDIRANLGAMQNRLESIITNLEHVSENTEQSKSRILDADIAAETAKLTRNAILQQAGSAILAQANAQPQMALQLLG